MTSMQGAVAELESLLESEKERIGGILDNVESVTGSLDSAIGEDGAQVDSLLSGLNRTMATLDAELAKLGAVSEDLSTVLRKLNEGEGTLGMLINDPSMYHRVDSTLDSINLLIADFQNNSAKYLREMKLVDLF